MIERREHIQHFVDLLRSGKMRYYPSTGRVYRIPRVKTGKMIRKPAISDLNYVSLKDCVNGKSYFAPAHRVIWEYLNGPVPDGFEINHKNGKKRDNRIVNLELATHSENIKHGQNLHREIRWNERKWFY